MSRTIQALYLPVQIHAAVRPYYTDDFVCPGPASKFSVEIPLNVLNFALRLGQNLKINADINTLKNNADKGREAEVNNQ